MLKYIILGLCFVSCDFSQKRTGIKTVNQSPVSVIPIDTLIAYDIDGISTEGAEAEVKYIHGIIKNSVVNIYAGTWQASIRYEFEETKIKVVEIKYSYKTTLENVKSDMDMKLDYEINYFIDFEGNVIGNPIKDRIDIFQEFKKVIPFELQVAKK